MSFTCIPEAIVRFPQTGTGRLEQPITTSSPGRVRFQATSWFAQFYDPACQSEVLLGEWVEIFGRRGNTLLVMPIGSDVVSQRSDRNSVVRS